MESGKCFQVTVHESRKMVREGNIGDDANIYVPFQKLERYNTRYRHHNISSMAAQLGNVSLD